MGTITSKGSTLQKNVRLPASGFPCTGCGLCVSICPKKAIQLSENAEGFLAAQVDETRCIGCGACETSCTRLGKVEGYTHHRYYEAWALNEEHRKAASSGGVFEELASDVIRRGGIVYGVAMQGGKFPHYTAVEHEAELSTLRGSKYLQADTGDVFAQMAAELKTGRPILFAGVSCQIRAARVRFGMKFPHLLLVDLACFGVPSRHLFRSFMTERSTRPELANIAFRDKSDSWRNYSMRLTYADGTTEKIPLKTNSYMRGFLCHLGLNECCYSCRSSIYDRPGDITLGDFWGRPRQNDDKYGVSVVITHTPKGEAALMGISPAMHIKAIEEDLALSRNGGVAAHTFRIPPQRSSFIRSLQRRPLQDVLNRFLYADGRPRRGLLLGVLFIPYPILLIKLWRKLKNR